MSKKRRDEDTRGAETLRIFSYLDGEMGPKDRAAFERAVLHDASLAATVASYDSLFNVLNATGHFAPTADFSVRVLASMVAPTPFWARLRKWVLGGPVNHRDLNPLTASLEGRRLNKRQARSLAAFFATEPDAPAHVAEWRGLFEELSKLPSFEPPAGFQDQVMARIRAETAARPARGKLTLRDRFAALWPGRRERLAAVSGALFGPTAVVAGTAYLTLSNPLVTPSNLLSYLWAKGSTLMNGAAETLLGGSLETGVLAEALRFLNGLTITGPLIAGGLVAFGALTLVSGWILYTNVIKAPSMDRSYVAA